MDGEGRPQSLTQNAHLKKTTRACDDERKRLRSSLRRGKSRRKLLPSTAVRKERRRFARLNLCGWRRRQLPVFKVPWQLRCINRLAVKVIEKKTAPDGASPATPLAVVGAGQARGGYAIVRRRWPATDEAFGFLWGMMPLPPPPSFGRETRDASAVEGRIASGAAGVSSVDSVTSQL
jgi:hypothetical protein